MFHHVIIGQYVRGNSIVHRFDARAKLLAVFIVTVFLFLANNWQTIALVTIFVIASIFFAKIPFRFLYKGLKPVLLLVFVTFLLHLIFQQDGEVLYSLGPVTIYKEGLKTGTFIAIRLISIVTVTSLLTLTTTPMELTNAFAALLTPLKKIGLPAHELAFMMSLALRFIPTLLEEAEKIIKAQTARGVDFSSGTLKERTKALASILLPLLISAFRRTEELAYAMEARGYRGGEGRTSLYVFRWQRKDTMLLMIVFIFASLLFVLRT